MRRITAFTLVSVILAVAVPPVHAASWPKVITLRSWRTFGNRLPSTPAYTTPALEKELAVLARSPKAKTVNLVIDSPARLAALAQYASQTADPKSPLFHHFLAPKTLLARFGPTPSMIASAKTALVDAGWHVQRMTGLLMQATVPAGSPAEIPVSPAIWSITGILPHGVIRPLTDGSEAAPQTAGSGLADYGFNEPPAVIQQTVDANGNTVSILSWNPGVAATVPSGLPLNLFVVAQNSAGQPIPITNVNNISDTAGNLAVYGASSMPGSNGTIWQVPVAGVAAQSAGDLLSLTVSLASGTVDTVTFTLPAFSGNATPLSPLTPPELNQIAGIPMPVAGSAPIAIFTLGPIPSLSDLNGVLTAAGDPAVTVTFHYEDGASAGETGPTSNLTEATLDLEAVAGSAPGTPIDEYVYPMNDPADPLISFLSDLSLQTSSKIASISYGFYGEDPATLSALMNTLTAEGITVVDASGDEGAWNTGSDPGPVGLDSLEQIPSVLSVGGLDLAAPATLDQNGNVTAITGPAIAKAWGGDYLNGLPTADAQAYTAQNAASTGGYSTTTPIPSWQASFLPTGAPGFGVPILSALAGEPGMAGILSGQSVIFGGTSLAAPLTAGWLADAEALLALSSTGLGNINPLLFHLAATDPAAFTQALWGSNGVYRVTSATPGSWNPVTGLGLINWGRFIQDYRILTGSATGSALTISITPSQPSVDAPVTLTATSAPSMVQPRYQFWVQNPANHLWQSSGPYQSSDHWTFLPTVPGTWHIVAFAASTGSTSAEVSTNVSVVSQSPMVSGLSLSTDPPTALVPAGTAVSLMANVTESGIGSALPEYQFWVHGPDNRWTLWQDYSPSNSINLTGLSPGSYTIAVYALNQSQVLAHDWAEAFSANWVAYIGSGVSLSANVPAGSNQPITLTAAASAVTNPVYQYWIEDPAGHWTASGPYSSNATWSFTPSQTGTYHVVVYAKDPYAEATAQDAVARTITIAVPG